MASGLLFAAALLAQVGTTAITVEGETDRVDVGYEELSQGRAELAIARIKDNKRLDSADPAALINLGSAYAMLGKTEAARSHYRAAMLSDDRCELELADGRWLDSRKAARLAEDMLDDGAILALR